MITNYLRDLSESRVFCNSYPVWKYYDVLYPVVLLRINLSKQGADPATGIAPDKMPDCTPTTLFASDKMPDQTVTTRIAPDKYIQTRDCSPLFKIYICVLPEKYANI